MADSNPSLPLDPSQSLSLDELAALDAALGELTTVVDAVVATLAKLRDVIVRTIPTLSADGADKGKEAPSSGSSLASADSALDAALGELTTVVDAVVATLAKLRDVIVRTIPTLSADGADKGKDKDKQKAPGKGAPSFGSSLASADSALASVALGPAAAVVAIQGLADAIGSVTGKLQGFVEAFNPTAVEMFNQALEGVQATIGQAFEPVFTILRGAMVQIGDIIAPVFQELRPIITDVTNTFVSALIPVVKAYARAMEATLPIMRTLAPLLGLLAAVIDSAAQAVLVWRVVILSLVDQLLGMMGGADAFKNATDKMVAATQWATRGLILFTARVLKLFNMNKQIEDLAKAFRPVKQGEGLAARPKDFAITGIEQVMQEQQLLAAQAGLGGDAEPRKQEDYLAGIEQALLALAKEQHTVAQAAQGIERFLQRNVDQPLQQVDAGGTGLVPAAIQATTALPLLRLLLRQVGG